MLEFVTDVPAPGEADDVWIEETPFFPADLPRLNKDPFGWTPKELGDALKLAERWRNTEPLTMQLVA